MKKRDIIVVAASTGGPSALKRLISAWPADLPAAVFVVVHIGAQPSLLPQVLQNSCALRIQHAVHEQEFQDSVVYIAPPDRHLIIQDGKTLLTSGPKENFTRPAADPLFRSAAINYGDRVIGIILTGHLDDGAAGLKAIDACGGFIAVQDPAESAAPSMPENALRAVKADVVGSVAELASGVARLLDQPVAAKPGAPNVKRIAAVETQIALSGKASVDTIESIGTRSPLTCPECGGVVWRIGENAPLRYRCHTGHAFSALSLEEVQREQTENALWSVVRGLQERLSLAKQQAANIDDPSEQAENSARIERLAGAEDAAYDLLLKTVRDT
ncbi:chemotaxis protein CheB [Paraburkholderia sp. IW21]|uniref:chemotaxis protein CheB n=1 Tax=Paraburkholderia sp. IW21 TaxID=3242488 RepID=UPI0035200437